MWRTRAVQTLLVEEIAGLARGESTIAEQEAGLLKARRRARLVAALDWTALVVWAAVRWTEDPILPLGPTEEAIFALVVVAIAVHSGFRLGQAEKLDATLRLWRDLRDRSEA